MRTTRPPLAVLALLLSLGLAAPASGTTVFSTDFESGIPPEISAPGSVLTGVQGYSGLGPTGRKFGGQFLRYTSVPLFPTRIVLHGLPAHDHLSVKFLLGIIDSWDGTELLQVRVDGALLFNHWFQLALGDSSDYYPPPPGALLSKGTDLGFSGCCYYNRDRAYDLGADPAFQDIPHTADSVVVQWDLSAISGPAAAQWQGGEDESWALDGIEVAVSASNVGVGDAVTPGERLFFAAPNPSHDGAATITFALRSTEPAALELVDLAGRTVVSREVGALGAGVHRVTLDAGQRVPAGVYFARLTAGGDVRTTRIVLLD
jgi:hypothetical protein